MYFPYIRGRQYDLIALRELIKNNLVSDRIFPIIEPVRESSTLLNTVETFNQNNKKIGIVINPEVGEIQHNYEYTVSFVGDNIYPAIIVDNSAKETLDFLKERGWKENQIIAVLKKVDYVKDYDDIFGIEPPLYTLFNDERSIRRCVKHGKIILGDRFNKQERNADYEDIPDEIFSDDHLFYQEEGCEGFGDYSIVGYNYDESGFAPKAVAIHVVYFDDDKILRVHHFVSDNNFGIEDLAGKYYEAVSKLIDWYQNTYNGESTYGLSALINSYNDGVFPGLATVKKLSIMHHIELMDHYLKERS